MEGQLFNVHKYADSNLTLAEIEKIETEKAEYNKMRGVKDGVYLIKVEKLNDYHNNTSIIGKIFLYCIKKKNGILESDTIIYGYKSIEFTDLIKVSQAQAKGTKVKFDEITSIKYIENLSNGIKDKTQTLFNSFSNGNKNEFDINRLNSIRIKKIDMSHFNFNDFDKSKTLYQIIDETRANNNKLIDDYNEVCKEFERYCQGKLFFNEDRTICMRINSVHQTQFGDIISIQVNRDVIFFNDNRITYFLNEYGSLFNIKEFDFQKVYYINNDNTNFKDLSDSLKMLENIKNNETSFSFSKV